MEPFCVLLARLFLTFSCETYNEGFSHFSVGVRLYTLTRRILKWRIVERCLWDAYRAKEAFAFGGYGYQAKSIITIIITFIIITKIIPNIGSSIMLSTLSTLSRLIFIIHSEVATITPDLQIRRLQFRVQVVCLT